MAALPPNRIDEEAWTLETTLPVGTVRAVEEPPGLVRVEPPAAAPTLRRMLNLDEDLSGFYALAADGAELAWVTGGAGRMLRSPSVFEDVVKTICTPARSRPPPLSASASTSRVRSRRTVAATRRRP